MRIILNRIRKGKRALLVAACLLSVAAVFYFHVRTRDGSSRVGELRNVETVDSDIVDVPQVIARTSFIAITSNWIVDIARKATEPKVLGSIDAKPNYNAHVFYYAWYGTPDVDGMWLHWNHRYLPHWDQKVTDMYPKGRHAPPLDIGANFYPQLGPYSSQDPAVIDFHMQEIRRARIGVVSISWYPSGLSDEEGKPVDPLVPAILDSAAKYDLKVCFHIEPFAGRNASTVRSSVIYLIDTYGNHSAFYRRRVMSSNIALPLFYIYDSYQTPPKEWRRLLGRAGSLSVRTTLHDALFVGLVVEAQHQSELYAAGFDGMYTYFVSDTFVYGSRPANWHMMASYCKLHNMLFVPSVGPGYADTRVRPWNSKNRKDREGGAYYDRYFAQALSYAPDIVSITSYNEWHEGTQIESAVPRIAGAGGYQYESYIPQNPDAYIEQTRSWIEKMPGTQLL